MARDNGKRGSYRHVSGSMAKETADRIELEHTSPVASSPTDSNVTPPLPTNFKNLKRDKIDNLGLLNENFFDSVPNSLNRKYPSMAVPGTMSRHSLSPRPVLNEQSPTWTEMMFAAGFWSFAIFGFLFTIYSGFSGIVAYIWGLVAEILGHIV